MSLYPGRIVYVRIGGPDEHPELRPAIVVKIWPAGCFNGQMFLDGLNDTPRIEEAADTQAQFSEEDCAEGCAWVTSVSEGDGIGEWRWPVRT